MIPLSVIEETAFQLMTKAAIEIPDDYLAGIKSMVKLEDGDLSAFVLNAHVHSALVFSALLLRALVFSASCLLEHPSGSYIVDYIE